MKRFGSWSVTSLMQDERQVMQSPRYTDAYPVIFTHLYLCSKLIIMVVGMSTLVFINFGAWLFSSTLLHRHNYCLGTVLIQ